MDHDVLCNIVELYEVRHRLVSILFEKRRHSLPVAFAHLVNKRVFGIDHEELYIEIHRLFAVLRCEFDAIDGAQPKNSSGILWRIGHDMVAPFGILRERILTPSVRSYNVYESANTNDGVDEQNQNARVISEAEFRKGGAQ